MNKILILLIFLISLSLFAINENIRKILENPSLFENIEKLYCVNSLLTLYEENNFEPFWTNKTIASTFIDTIGSAKYEGLDPDDYHYQYLSKNKVSSESPGLKDILLTDSFLLYANHLLSGKLNPVDLHPEWNAQKRKEDVIRLFKSSVNNKNLLSELEKTKPQTRSYFELKKKLKYYYDLDEDITFVVSKGSLIKPGSKDKRIPEIRENLAIIEKVKLHVPEDSTLYDDEMYSILKNFQKRHGLNSDGIIGDNTLSMLNLSKKERINKIRVNLERLRWMPEDYGKLYILINLANYKLSYYRDNQFVESHNLIIGKSYRKTPVFSDRMTYLVFNPTWTVPPTILFNDIIPAVRKDRDYLKKKNIRIFKNNEVKSPEISVDDIDWTTAERKNFRYRLVQDPGPNNSLGEVKFMFPNQYNIYLHDTPDKSLFQKEERSFSSGCLRLENPLNFAELLLRDIPGWNMEKINNVISTRKETTVNLKIPINVHIQYLTTWVDENGDIQFRNDIYKRDEAVAEALNKKPGKL
ncbi:MAG: L,D-transpeptidase family protein [Candidatus Delongbacteria bacterium]|nr:L,D-transpeptidase family protein [Candidatus Delongbacteria bacterium]